MSALVMPSPDDFAAPGETLVRYLDSGPDGQGRRTFFAYWIADNVGPYADQHGVRGQIFVTQPEKFAARNAPVREWSR